jgi:hypothetical protein
MNTIASRDAEVRRLSALPKRELARLFCEGPGKTLVWSAAPPERWSKGELVNQLLAAFDAEYVRCGRCEHFIQTADWAAHSGSCITRAAVAP